MSRRIENSGTIMAIDVRKTPLPVASVLQLNHPSGRAPLNIMCTICRRTYSNTYHLWKVTVCNVRCILVHVQPLYERTKCIMDYAPSLSHVPFLFLNKFWTSATKGAVEIRWYTFFLCLRPGAMDWHILSLLLYTVARHVLFVLLTLRPYSGDRYYTLLRGTFLARTGVWVCCLQVVHSPKM